jgi:parallel beta-helix repeat protein
MGLLALFSLLIPARLSANVLADTTFNSGSPWMLSSYAFGGASASPPSVSAEGTMDALDAAPSNAAVLAANASGASGVWGAGLNTAWISVNSPETNLAHLNLAFDLWTSHPATVRVKIDSYVTQGGQNILAGSRHAYVTPPVEQAFFRHSLDLSEMTSLSGAFAPNAKWIVVTFELGNGPGHLAAPWPSANGLSLRVDNLAFSSPRYYVDGLLPSASDTANNGRSLAAPFKTVQKAVNVAAPGDVIMVRDGTYRPDYTYSVAQISTAGSPSRWITLRAYPGHTPVFTGSRQTRELAWNLIRLEPTAAYIEIRGITGRGINVVENVTVTEGEADLALRSSTYYGSPVVNGNGFSAYGNANKLPSGPRPHHLRFIDNHIYETGGGGLGAIESDYVTIQGNLVHDTALTSSYAPSGISLFHLWNFHPAPGYRNFILNNTVHSNRSLVGWYDALGQSISDGNGIIIDDSRNTQSSSKIQGQAYLGRTLIANNVAFNNGGGGIQIFKSDHVDVVNNTAYQNGSVQPDYGEIYVNQGDDVRVHNNIMWARSDRPINQSKGTNTNLVITHNIFVRDGWNSSWGISWGVAGNNNLFANPRFVAPSTDAAVADFRLLPDSPARNTGILSVTGVPRIDFDGFPRPIETAIDRGAHEYAP